MTVDWHDAQVIEATTPVGRRLLLGEGRGWFSALGMSYYADELSDVRVIVDGDGNVAPPPITDEMVERAARVRAREWHDDAPYQADHEIARAALTAALGGAK